MVEPTNPFNASPPTPAPAAAPISGNSDERMIKNLVDVTSLLILSATASEPRTVRDLSMELNLPIATLYRKVRSLQIAGALLAHKVKDRATGKETMVYESAVTGVNIKFSREAPHFEVGFRNV